MLTRRKFLSVSSAALLAGTVTPAWAVSSLLLGDMQIDIVSDGHLDLPASFTFSGLPQDTAADLIKRYGLPSDGLQPDCNLTLVRQSGRVILFDVGAGPNFMSSAGKVAEALEAIDVDPSDVTDIVFTHAHPDHLWGVLDDFDDPMFSEARHHIAAPELDYWLDPNTVNSIDEARQAFAAGAARNLHAVDEMIVPFKPGQEILPGIFARFTPGHTPGHTSFEIRSGSKSLLVVGDAISNHHLAFEYPDWESNSDQDKALGATTRVNLLGELASNQMRIVGFHFPYPGIGFVERKGKAFRWVAA
ncbi:MAG: MBL fold metallo-hydrolase [Rhizobiaceae bacterium]